jgi:hypothetical protein
MHNPSHLTFSQKDILSTVVRHNKAKAVTMTLDRAEAITIAWYGDIIFAHTGLS